MAITNKQARFIDEYLRDSNATQAAIRAGYSQKTAGVIGHENLKKPNIAAEIQRRVEEKHMSSDEVLRRLAEHARGDMGDFLDISSMSFQIDLEKAKEKGITHLIKKVKMRTTTTVDKSGIETETHDIEIELYDAQAALVQLGRYHKLFTDKMEVAKKSYRVTIDGEDIDDD